MAGAGLPSGSTLGTTVEVVEIESLSDGNIIIGDGSGAPTTRAAFPSQLMSYLVLNPTAAADISGGVRCYRGGGGPAALCAWDAASDLFRFCTSTDGTLGGTLVDVPVQARQLRIPTSEGLVAAATAGGAVGLLIGRTNNDTTFIGSYGSMISGIVAGSGGFIGFAGGNAVGSTNAPLDTTVGVYLSRKAVASLRMGTADAASPVAQTLTVQGVVAGTSNVAGAAWTLDLSQSTGTGAGGSLIIRGTPAGGSGTSQNAYSTLLTVATAGVTATVPIDLPAGASGAPALRFTDATTGWYRSAANSWMWETSATPAFGLVAGQNGTVLYSSWGYKWGSSDATSTPDTGVNRNAAGIAEINNGSAGTYRDLKLRTTIVDGANGAVGEYTLLLDEELTVAAAAFSDTAAQIPAGATVMHVAERVTTAIPTAATWTLGVAGATARYATGIAVAANTTNTIMASNGAGVHFTAAASLRLTPDVQPADATGRVRIKAWGYRATAPTS